MCIYHASHGRRTCTYVVDALCDVSAFSTSVLFLRAFPTLLHEVSVFPSLFTDGARAKPQKKWGALGACHALNALNARIFFSRWMVSTVDSIRDDIAAFQESQSFG
jgi:hypothetical protein